METTNFISLDALFETDNDFIKLIEEDEELMQEYLTGLLKIRRSLIRDQNKLIEYYMHKTGITDIYNLKMLEMMRLSAFLTLVKHCPYIREYMPDFEDDC
jgi:hypothetical protein